MGDKVWKEAERRVAKALNAKRIPAAMQGGSRVGERADVENDWLSVEVKRRDVPQWITHGMQQAERAAEGKLPLLALVIKRQHIGEAMVCMRLRDFQEHFVGGKDDAA